MNILSRIFKGGASKKEERPEPTFADLNVGDYFITRNNIFHFASYLFRKTSMSGDVQNYVKVILAKSANYQIIHKEIICPLPMKLTNEIISVELYADGLTITHD